MFNEELDESCIVSDKIDRPSLDLGEHTFVEVLDRERHAAMLANPLTARNE